MSKHFRPWKIDETQLLPPSVQDYVPEDHLSRFIVALVRRASTFPRSRPATRASSASRRSIRRMMTALLLYGYASGIYSSRRIEKACERARRLHDDRGR